MAAPDMEVIKEIPGYKVILKAVLKSQIQQLVEQLASSTDEESVILTASVADGTLCHLGSSSGKVFLEDHEDIKSQFLGFCLKHHHKQKQEKERKEAQEREDALTRSMQPMYGDPSVRQRSPRFPLPGQQGLHPVSLSRASPGRMRSPTMRHQPYPMPRGQRPRLNLDQSGRSPTQISPMKVPMGNKADGQVIKIEPDDDNDKTNDSDNGQGPTGASAADSSQPSSPSVKPTTPSQGPGVSDNDDAKSESSNSTIPNEASDLKLSDTNPPGGLSLDSDLSNIISASASGSDTNNQAPVDSGSVTQADYGLDPNVSVKLEQSVTDAEMDLEITGVELGHRPAQEPSGSQDWMSNVQDIMQGATGNPADMSGQQGYSTTAKNVGVPTYVYKCEECGKMMGTSSKLMTHMRTHTNEKPFPCPHCPLSFCSNRKRKKHEKLVHGVFQYRNRSFNVSADMTIECDKQSNI